MAAGDGSASAFKRRVPEVGPATLHVTGDTTGIGPNIGFVAKVTGIVALKARWNSLEGEAYIDHPVAAGSFYPLDVRDLDITNSTASQEVTVYLVK